MSKKFHVILPTCNYEIMKNKFFNSIKYFRKLKDIVSFGICFQNYSQEQIKEIIDEFNKYNLDVQWAKRKYADPAYVPMHRIRNICCQLNNQCDYYFVIDDDLWYEDEEEFINQFLVAIDYLNNHLDCGVLFFKRTYSTRFPKKLNVLHEIRVNLGCFIKNIYPNGNIVPEEYLDLVGGYQDVFFTYIRLMTEEYYPAFCDMKKAYHVDSKPNEEVSFNKYNWKKIAEGENGNYTILKELWKKYPRYIKKGNTN